MSQDIQCHSRYSVLALQLDCHAINQITDVEVAREQVTKAVHNAAHHIRTCSKFTQFFTGLPLRLVVLPEFLFTGFPFGQSTEEWRDRAAFEPDGPEFEILSKAAQDANTFVAGNAYEKDPNFPEMYFQTCFIIAPNGDVILRYRRLTSSFEPTPHDVLDKYLDIYGLEGLFPVAKTEIGNLACIASEEIFWPELSRLHVLRGAEIIIHPTSEPGAGTRTARDVCKQTRAAENMAYVVSANTSSIQGSVVPAETCCGFSKIVDYKGNILSEAAEGGESHWASDVIELDALRDYRRRVGMANLLARQPVDIYGAAYSAIHRHPSNTFLKNGEVVVPPGHDWFNNRQAGVIREMEEKGWI